MDAPFRVKDIQSIRRSVEYYVDVIIFYFHEGVIGGVINEVGELIHGVIYPLVMLYHK